ncbi:cytochrome c [Paenibacillus pasadenensis]|uniref:c-type cytochrome n=1 Tax=Paenibacillus pasadenensis TaxID=217090 RepID=UPI002041FA61|nr:cytochrome c [Paenibacillus pasadenensis]MCM3747972.1 cytochrome c [Paenibacillus pasadenensis]
MYKWIMAGLMSAAALFAVFILLTQMPEKEEVSEGGAAFSVPEREVDAAAAQLISKNMCISCHGTDLKGGIGPDLTKIGSSLTKEQLYKTISEGRGGMPAFKDRLTEDEMITMATWLSSLK